MHYLIFKMTRCNVGLHHELSSFKIFASPRSYSNSTHSKQSSPCQICAPCKKHLEF